jgi:hypothetical protein
MIMGQLFSQEKKESNEFFKVPSHLQRYFDLKKKEEDMGKDIAKRIIKKISEQPKRTENY